MDPGRRGSKTRDTTRQSLWSLNVSARKDTGAFELGKDLVLEVPRFPLTRRRALPPNFQPCGQGSYFKAYVLDAFVPSRIQKAAHVQTTPCLSLTKLFIAGGNRRRNRGP